MTSRRFEMHRDVDPTGISGIGLVAEGVRFSDGVAIVHWVGEWPTSVVVHPDGIDAVRHIHGHAGLTRIVFLDPE